MALTSSFKEINNHLKAIHQGNPSFREAIVDKLKLRLHNKPASQKTLNACFRIALKYIENPSKVNTPVVAAVGVLVEFGAKWDSDTLFQLGKTPFQG